MNAVMTWRARERRRTTSSASALPALALLVGLLAVAACGDSLPNTTTLLKDAQAKLNTTQSFHFQMKVDHPGAPSNGGYIITSADGDVSRPASLHATATVDAGFVNVNVSLIIIGQQEWYTDPISQKYVTTDQFAYFLNIFDSQQGLGALMTQLQNPSAPADGSANGQSCWKITGTLSPSLLQPLFSDVVATQPIPTSYCIGKSDGRLYSATLAGAITEGDTSKTVYTFYLSKFDAPVTITPPPGV
ncbi:MAG TPA: LppX_LprAFG lipoprotein [Ktedonobacterales bacterium]|nr:LppX_LprAFG lipoprotein [Ktedonobacterales bacterium]